MRGQRRPRESWPCRLPRTRSLPAVMERFGLVGLPNAGKSSLYNALTGGGALAAPYAFATKDPNIGVAKVPDDRLDRPGRDVASRKNVVPRHGRRWSTSAASSKGASKGEGLGNRFLANIREVDAIVFVLRAFEDDDVPGPQRSARAPPRRRARAGARRPRDRREAARPGRARRPSSTRSLGRRGRRAATPPTTALSDGTPALPGRARRRPRASCCAPYFLLTNTPRARRGQRRRGRARLASPTSRRTVAAELPRPATTSR